MKKSYTDIDVSTSQGYRNGFVEYNYRNQDVDTMGLLSN